MKPMLAARLKTATVLTLSLAALAGCVEIPYLQASSADADRYDFRASEGNSRVFFFRDSDAPFAAYIDGIDVGSVSDRGEYLRAEIPAGPHLLQWKDLANGSGKLQGDARIVMESGQPYVLRVAGNGGRIDSVGKAGSAALSSRTLVLADPEVTGRVVRPAAQTAVSAAGSAAVTPQSIKDKLSELKSLYDGGLITKDEYDGKRKQMLERWN